MHGDLMLLHVSTLALDHDRFPRRSKSWAKLLSISLPSSFRDHPSLAKYRSLGNLQLLSIRRLFTGLCSVFG